VTVTTPEALGFEVFARLAAELGRRLRIGSLFTGYGGLDLAVEEVTGGEVVWVCDPDPGARQILAYRYPGVPNLGDITRMRDPLDPEALGELFDLATSWADVTPVDVLCGGFPCQDVSSAGRRAGLAGARSGLWAHFARAIAELRPRFVVIENVYGLLGAKAGRSADALDPDLAALLEGDAADPADAEVLAELETLVHEHQEGTDAEAAADLTGDDVGSDDGDVGDGDARPVLLRAMGAVLGDLSDLGYDATWITVAASDVGAPHRRRRVFILAWDAAYPAGAGRRPEGRGTGDGAGPAGVGSPEPDGCGRATTADALREAGGGGTGLREAGPGRVGRGRPDDGRVPSGEHGEPADADDPRREGAESAGRRLVPAGGGRADDPLGAGSPADAEGERGTEGLTESARVERRPHADERDPAAPRGGGDASPADPGRGGVQRWTDARGVGGEARPRAGEGIQRERRRHPAGGHGAVPPDPGSERRDRGQDSDRARRHQDERDEACDHPRGGGVAAALADPGRDGRSLERVEGERRGREGAPRHEPDRRAREGRCPTCADPTDDHDAGGFCAGDCGGTCTAEWGRPADGDASGRVGEDEPARSHEPGEPVSAEPGAVSGDRGGDPAAGVRLVGRPAGELAASGDDYDRRFGPYAAAVRRWSAVLGRRAPDPTEAGAKGGRRLNPAFVEHMMGLPAGWVTAPAVWVGFRGNARNAQLKALGNGVVPRQAALALRILALWHVAAVSGDASEVDPPSREEVLA
jgi:site-specific DNA-cytosine methylase